jgi:hypothetical protein
MLPSGNGGCDKGWFIVFLYPECDGVQMVVIPACDPEEDSVHASASIMDRSIPSDCSPKKVEDSEGIDVNVDTKETVWGRGDVFGKDGRRNFCATAEEW